MAVQLTWKLTFLIISLGLGLLGFMAYLSYLDAKTKKKEQKRFTEPVFIALIITLLVGFALFILEAFGWLPEGDAKKYMWGLPLLGIGVYFFADKRLAVLKAKQWHQIKKAVRNFLWDEYKARLQKGKTFGPPIEYFGIEDTNDENKMDKVMNVLCKVNTGYYILVFIDINNLYITKSIHDPDTSYIERLKGKKAAQQYDLQRELMRKNLIDPDQYPELENENNNQRPATQTA